MKQAAEKIQTILNGDSALQTILVGKSYWELGREGEETPVVVFSIVEIPGASKDRRSFGAVLRCYGKDMDKSAELSELVRTVMEDSGQHFAGSQSGITDSDEREAVVEMNYNLKL